LEATTVTTLAAAVRRSIKLDIPRTLAHRIPSQAAQQYTIKYLDFGEYCLDRAIGAFRYLQNKEAVQQGKTNAPHIQPPHDQTTR